MHKENPAKADCFFQILGSNSSANPSAFRLGGWMEGGVNIAIKFQLLSAIAAIAISHTAQAYPGESIVQDVNGDYTITYKSSDDSVTGLMTTVFVPATKIIPSLRSSFRVDERGIIIYRYAASNGVTAKQAITTVLLEQVVHPVVGEQGEPAAIPSTMIVDVLAFGAANSAATPAPAGWEGDITRSMSRIDWMPKSEIYNTGGIKPGQTLAGFGFASRDLPGVSTAQMRGRGSVFGYPDEGPAEDSAILDELNRLIHNDFIVRPAAVPMVAVPTPFNAATLLGSIQTQTHTWIAMNLLDATFSSQLDRYLTAAADAYRHNQPKAGREDIEAIRKMLKREHEDLDREDERAEDKDHDKGARHAQIDPLAARVLDFDLKYVLKWTEEGKD